MPHSCGQVCEREFKPPCGHKCLLLCHPGELYITLLILCGMLFLMLRPKKKKNCESLAQNLRVGKKILEGNGFE